MEDDEIEVAQYFRDHGLLLTFKSEVKVIDILKTYYTRRGSDTIIPKDRYAICVNKIEDLTTEELRIILWNLWKLKHNIKIAPAHFEINKIEKPDLKSIFEFLRPNT